jgi:two-component system, OmpR family, sensor histidine kinase KdpD
VLGLKPQEEDQGLLTLEQRSLLEAYANLSALAIERASFAEQAAHSRELENKEQLQAALLNSISHELRTPLASITGVLTSLGESHKAPPEAAHLDPATQLELIDSATEQARQLNHLVENLLDMSRLEAGALRLNLETADLQDVVGSVAHSMAERLKGRRLTIHIPLDFPPLRMDVRLVAQVLTNLLDNAIKYSPPGSPVELEVRQEQEWVVISVCDSGFGIPPADLERVFDKFYRVESQPPRLGTGLGLSISKGFVEAHGGRIGVRNNPGTGVTVEFSLPLGAGERQGSA